MNTVYAVYLIIGWWIFYGIFRMVAGLLGTEYTNKQHYDKSDIFFGAIWVISGVIVLLID